MKRIFVIILILLILFQGCNECKVRDYYDPPPCKTIYGIAIYDVNGYNLLDIGEIDTTSIVIVDYNNDTLGYSLKQDSILGTIISIKTDSSSVYCIKATQFRDANNGQLKDLTYDTFYYKFYIRSSISVDSFLVELVAKTKSYDDCNEYYNWRVLFAYYQKGVKIYYAFDEELFSKVVKVIKL